MPENSMINAIKLESGAIRFFITDYFLEKYNLSIEGMRCAKYYPADFIDGVYDWGEKIYDVKFDREKVFTGWFLEDEFICDIFPKSNIVKLSNEYIRGSRCVKDLKKLFLSLPDKKILTGNLKGKERKKYLWKLRMNEEFIKDELFN